MNDREKAGLISVTSRLKTKVKNTALPLSAPFPFFSVFDFLMFLLSCTSYFQHRPEHLHSFFSTSLDFAFLHLSLSIAPQRAAVDNTGEGSVAPLMRRITGRESWEEKWRFVCWPCPDARHWMVVVMLVQGSAGYEEGESLKGETDEQDQKK